MHFSKLAAVAFVLATPLGCAESGTIDPLGAAGVAAGSSHKPPNGGSGGTAPKGGTGGGGTGGTTTGGTGGASGKGGSAGSSGTGGASGKGGSSGSGGTAGSSGSGGSGGTAGSSGSAGEAGAGGGTCVGAPYPCADLGPSECAVSSGCTLAAACNSPFCVGAEDKFLACLALAAVGCSFDSGRPAGNQCFAAACAGGADAASCNAIFGCAFSGPCSGTPDDCATLGRTACQNQLGCSWE